DRKHVRIGVVGACMTAAVAEGVELLDIADRKRGLFCDKGTKADLEGAVGEWIERARRQTDGRLFHACDQNLWAIAFHRDDRRGEPDLDRCKFMTGHAAKL